MRTLYFDFYDKKRSRTVPVAVYLPKKITEPLPTVIFGPGYQGQEELEKKEPVYKRYTYLAEYFTGKDFAFVTIQHDILGDKDGLEIVDPKAVQDETRRHLYKRGEANILFVLDELRQQNLSLNLKSFILGGHSNGGDIAKYFVNNNVKNVTALVLFDARRARLLPQSKLKVLMFEANDTTTDLGVIPEPANGDNSLRSNLDLVIIKPTSAKHVSYMDDHITDELKSKVEHVMNWSLTGVK